MPSPNHRIEKVAEFVQAHLHEAAEMFPAREHNPVYRWQHTQRVAQYGRQIAEAEKANVEVVVAACLLHDVAHFEADPNYKDHGRIGAKLARPLLEKWGYSAEEVDNICYCVAVHVDDNAGYEHAHTLEARVTSDADNVDRFGAYRIVLWCLEEERLGDYNRLIEKLTNRIQRLEHYRANNPLETPTGRMLFAQLLDRQIQFFSTLITESQLTKPPDLDTLPVAAQ